MFHSLALALLSGLLPAFAWPAVAEVPQAPPAATLPGSMPCSGYPQIIEQLSQRYSEQPTSLGMQGNGNLLELFTSDRGDTWTLLSLEPSGIACVVAAGSDWGDVLRSADDGDAAGNGI